MLPAVMISHLATGEASVWVRHAKRKALLVAIAAFLGLSAYAVSLAGAVIWIGGSYGMMPAAFLVAAALGVTALLIVAAMSVLERTYQRKRRKAAARNALYASTLAAAAPTILRSKPLMLVAVAAGGAILASRIAAGNSTST